MKLPRTEGYLKEGIKMSKVLVKGHMSGGFLSSYWNEPTYDYKTVYDLEESIRLTHQGWSYDNFSHVFACLALYLWRDLKNIELPAKPLSEPTPEASTTTDSLGSHTPTQ